MRRGRQSDQEYEQAVGVQSNYVNRLSPMFATLEMAFSIAHNHVLLTDEHTEMDETEKLVFRNFLLDIFKAQLTNIDHSGAAYDRLKNFIVENIRKFKYSDYLPNTTQTFGKITMKAKSRGYEVFILQDILEKFFREAGYTSPLVVLKEWRGKGLVKSEQDRLTARVKGLSDGRLTGYCIIFEQGTFDDYLQDSSGIQSSLFDAQLSKPRISRLQPHEIKRTKPIISEEPSMSESIDLSIDVELPPQDEDDI